jgi:hypothetical protein
MNGNLFALVNAHSGRNAGSAGRLFQGPFWIEQLVGEENVAAVIVKVADTLR